MSTKQFDPNMLVNPKITRPGIKFYNADEAPFKIYGVWRDGDRYFRMPREIAKTVSAGVGSNCENTAGGRVRFKTDSPYVAFHVKLDGIYQFTSMPFTGTCGLDVYDGNVYRGTVRPNVDTLSDVVEEIFYFAEKTTHTVTLNLPLYCAVEEIYIGLDSGASVLAPDPYEHELPVVFYGSSITNGASASRPGMTYEAILSRRLDFNHHNLGFGGLAKGEVEMAQYIAGLDMCAFVLDYDYNAPSTEHLMNTHERFFKIVREKHPTLPILIVTGPRVKPTPDREERKRIIKQTYDNAVKAGDENVYLLFGDEFFGDVADDFTSDGTHPTDLGFWCMANAMTDTLARILKG